MKKLLIIGSVVVVGLVAAGAGLIFIKWQAPSPDEVFRSYLEKFASSDFFESEESFSGTGATLSDKGSLDTASKKFIFLGDLACTAKIENKDINFSATIQVENTVLYVKLNEVTGEINLNDGSLINLSNTFSKTKDVWYKLTSEDPAAQAQLDSGVYVFNSAIIAPSYDTKKIVDALINKKAITYNSNSKDGDNFVFDLTVNKSAYLEVLKEVFPNLNNPDLILDDIFYEGTTRNSTITVKEDGALVNEKLSDENLCEDMIVSFIGGEPTGMSKEVTGVSTPKPKGSVIITPITTSKPIEELQNDLVF